MDKRAAKKQPRHDTGVSGLNRMPQVPCELAQIVKCNGSATRPCDGLRMSREISSRRKQGDSAYVVRRFEGSLDSFIENKPCPNPARAALRRVASGHYPLYKQK